MRCAQCGRETTSKALFCGQCGGLLSMAAGPTAEPAGRIRLDLDAMTTQLGEDYAALTAALDARLAGYASPAGAAGLMPSEAGDWSALLAPRADEVYQSARFVLASPFIQGNAAYAERIGQVTFAGAGGDDTVNAFATDHPLDLPDGGEIAPPVIVYLGGLATAVRLAAAGVALHLEAQAPRSALARRIDLPDLFGALGAALAESGGRFDPRAAQRIMARAGAPAPGSSAARAQTLASSMDMFVVAHEAGHIALAHTLGRAHNLDVARNQEREADSFAASALSASPFREYLFIGQVFVAIIFAWLDAATGAEDPGTHPLGRERALNALTSNSEAAGEAADRFGLSRERLLRLLPA